jgi:hypothetical protein
MTGHGPLKNWLLLAATASVYAIVVVWVSSEPYPTPPYAWALFDALTLSWLGLASMWSALRSEKTIWSRIAPFAAVPTAALLVAAVVNDPASLWDRTWINFAYYGLGVALLLTALWSIQRTRLWQRRYASARHWRFSTAELLIVMTTVAVLAVALRRTPMVVADGWLSLAVIASSVAVAVANVVVWSLPLHWLPQLSSAMSVAVLLGVILSLMTDAAPIFAEIIGADLLIQSLVFSIWLSVGSILPASTSASGGESSPPSPREAQGQ